MHGRAEHSSRPCSHRLCTCWPQEAVPREGQGSGGSTERARVSVGEKLVKAVHPPRAAPEEEQGRGEQAQLV